MEPLSIVTSCHGYGMYLMDWAESLLASEVRPAFVGILTHGSDRDREAGEAAFQRLKSGMFPVKHLHEPTLMDFGAARNAAVAMTTTPWVMHLDADDMLMTHALGDIAALMPRADVIPLGYERVGDLASGPRQRQKVYRSSQGAGTIANPCPASGVSPFRRSFWELTPYRTDMVGGWDTALWLGFAHQGARFVATSRPGFWYRQHSDSLFNTRRLSDWPAVRTGVKLQALRQGMAGVDFIIPRDVHAEPCREANWRWLRRRYQALFPGWGIREGCSDRTPWRKGQAIERALVDSRAEVLIISDGDCIVPREALQEAVRIVASGEAGWVVPHQMVHRLNATRTAQWLDSEPDGPVELPAPGDLARQPYHGTVGGGILVVGRAEYIASRGIPKGFKDWGSEDATLGIILDSLVGPHTRLDFPLVHLWHPPQGHEQGRAGKLVAWRANQALYQRYLQARENEARIWALVTGGRSRPAGPYFDAITRHRTAAVRSQAIRDEVTAARPRSTTNTTDARKTAMAGSLENARAYRLKRQEQRRRNEEAIAARKSGAKAMARAPENKMMNPPAVKFASTQAEQLAKDSGLLPADFGGIEAGSRGVTLPQVKALLDDIGGTDSETGEDQP